jgi:hypothetical protein
LIGDRGSRNGQRRDGWRGRRIRSRSDHCHNRQDEKELSAISANRKKDRSIRRTVRRACHRFPFWLCATGRNFSTHGNLPRKAYLLHESCTDQTCRLATASLLTRGDTPPTTLAESIFEADG